MAEFSPRASSQGNLALRAVTTVHSYRWQFARVSESLLLLCCVKVQPILLKFSHTHRGHRLKRLWAAGSLKNTLDLRWVKWLFSEVFCKTALIYLVLFTVSLFLCKYTVWDPTGCCFHFASFSLFDSPSTYTLIDLYIHFSACRHSKHLVELMLAWFPDKLVIITFQHITGELITPLLNHKHILNMKE